MLNDCYSLCSERKLVTWLRLLFRTQTLIDTYYQDWSYVARTGTRLSITISCTRIGGCLSYLASEFRNAGGGFSYLASEFRKAGILGKQISDWTFWMCECLCRGLTRNTKVVVHVPGVKMFLRDMHQREIFNCWVLRIPSNLYCD